MLNMRTSPLINTSSGVPLRPSGPGSTPWVQNCGANPTLSNAGASRTFSESVIVCPSSTFTNLPLPFKVNNAVGKNWLPLLGSVAGVPPAGMCIWSSAAFPGRMVSEREFVFPTTNAPCASRLLTSVSDGVPLNLPFAFP